MYESLNYNKYKLNKNVINKLQRLKKKAKYSLTVYYLS